MVFLPYPAFGVKHAGLLLQSPMSLFRVGCRIARWRCGPNAVRVQGRRRSRTCLSETPWIQERGDVLELSLSGADEMTTHAVSPFTNGLIGAANAAGGVLGIGIKAI
jgi:hypothetical protein